MTNVVYAIKTYELSAENFKITDVKIGRTANIKSTMAQYNRSHRKPEILNLWLPNEKIQVSQCEKGVLNLAQKYAHERTSETFRFLQDDYSKFSSNISCLLVETSFDNVVGKKQPKQKVVEGHDFTKKSYTGEKPLAFIYKGNRTEVLNWLDLYKIICKNIYQDVDNFESVLDLKGRSREYFSEGRPQKMVKPVQIPESNYYLEGNISADGIIRNIKKLFDIFGYNYQDLIIQTKEQN